ncbi:hypothetical protein DPMN_128638 [Dreissena polymorpha]|uniref:Uncharacterized protein n=1 Tax=Dreissena polymorpha TaxID=45954 RepID=A0A9D4K0D1_DREPO|nr:hypothetical protein DPMN_128638 [Dreissena polymorpha]
MLIVKIFFSSREKALLQKFSSSDADETSDYNFSFGNLFRCVCCPRPRPDATESKFELVIDKLESLERALGGNQVTRNYKFSKTTSV